MTFVVKQNILKRGVFFVCFVVTQVVSVAFLWWFPLQKEKRTVAAWFSTGLLLLASTNRMALLRASTAEKQEGSSASAANGRPHLLA